MNIRIENLYHKFNNEYVFKDLSFSFDKGKYYVIKGANGTGKSTLVRLLSKELKPVKNKIYIDNKDILDVSEQKISYLPQKNLSLNYKFPLTCKEILFASMLKKDLNKVKKVLQIVKLEKYIDTDFNFLSGGQLQRLLVARMLLLERDVLILDEPFVGIDKDNVKVLIDVLSDINKSGKTVILITHNLTLLENINYELLDMDIYTRRG